MQPDLSGQIQAELSHLGPEGQQKVLDFVRSLNGKKAGSSLPPGTPAAEFLRIAQSLDFSPEDLRQMSEAIEEGCGQVDPDEW